MIITKVLLISDFLFVLFKYSNNLVKIGLNVEENASFANKNVHKKIRDNLHNNARFVQNTPIPI